MELKHFALLCKGWYKKPDTEKNPEAMWAYVQKALEGDNYMPQDRKDIIGIIITNVTPFINKSASDFALDMISSCHKANTFMMGYITKESNYLKWINTVEYDYYTAVLYFYMSKVKFMSSEILGDLPLPDIKIMPTIHMTKKQREIFKK